MLNSSAMEPLYVQLIKQITKDIDEGKYRPGDKIMTEAEMVQHYGVSVITVRKAVGTLVEKGVLNRRQGKGTFVSRPKFSRNIKKLQSFSEMCYQMGVEPGAKMIENQLVTADDETAKRLGVELGSKVVSICRLRSADGVPVVVEKNYFPLKYAFLLDARFDDNSLFDFLKEKSGLRVAASEKVIELCRATALEAEHLRVKKGDPLLLVKSTAFDNHGEPFYAGEQIINGDSFSLYVYETDGE